GSGTTTILNTAAPIRDPDGHIVGGVMAEVDITEQRRAQEALRNSEALERQRAREMTAALAARDQALAQLNSLLENAPLGFAFFDREHRYTRINEFLALKINGLPVEAHLGRSIREVLSVNAPAVDPLLDTVFATSNPVDNLVVAGETPAAPGVKRHWLTAWFPVRTPDGAIPWVGAVVLEITEQKRTEAALKRRNQHLQLLHQASARLLVGQHPVQLLRQLHAQIAQVFGADVFMLYQTVHGDDRLQLLACAGVSDQERHKLETMRYGRAVCAKPAEALRPIVATHIQDREAPNRRFVRKLGFRSYLYYPLILNNHLHGTVAFASRTRDDYDRTDLDFFHTIAGTLAEALERERLESELHRHATKLERTVQERTAKLRESIAELEGFSYSLVHDMRAPLRAMLSYAGILELDAGPRLQSDEADLLRKIKLAAHRMDQLITDSLNYSRILRQDLPLGPVNLGHLLRGMIETYPNLHPPQADVSIKLGDLLVHGNEAALTQVFSNLLGNAVKFVAPGVHPRVRIWAEARGRHGDTETRGRGDVEPPLSASPPLRVPASSVRVWVEDNGIGIPKDQQGKIFGMFQRLHRAEQYPGTGIGLALVKKSIERTGGQITLESEPGKGSRFCVELPLATTNTPEIAAE
ncbi:MAG TPA: ATP-binding protein, partial [Clostridia bacterium]|nr:ATP-binding protein [Clostridia bacterium]